MHVFAAGAAHTLEQLAEEQQDVPVVLGRALHVAALPGLAHQVRHVPAWNHASALQVALVAHDDDGRLRGADHPRLQDLLTDSLDVLKAVKAADVIDQDVGVDASESPAAGICPLLQCVDREGADGWEVQDLQVVHMAIHDHSRQVEAAGGGGHTDLAELVV